MQNTLKDIAGEVLAANDIAEVIGAYLDLKPAGGSRLKALCPFHAEKTPSFTVNRDRQSFYCFGCEKGGDAITFLREHEGLGFREALEQLAEGKGIRLPEFGAMDRGRGDERTQILSLGKLAAQFFGKTLSSPLNGEAGRNYLATRGLKDETISRFGLGYVPDQWSSLTDHAKKEGVKESALVASGLAKRGERGGVYDLFRNRLIVPIKDVTGNIVAFGGRDLGDSAAKYINSPENAVYKKARVLYGLHEARDGMRAAKEAILVEGYFDVLRCFDAGIDNAVASCGTALTPEQAALIRRYVPSVLVVFDGDAAGVRAALRGVGILVGAGLTVRALVLPTGQDPDDYIRAEGAEAFRALAHQAMDFVTFYVRMNEERVQTIEGRTDVAKELFTILGNIEDGLRLDEYLKRLANELGLNLNRCKQEFSKFLQERSARRRPTRESEQTPASHVDAHDRDFIAVLLDEPSLIAQVRNAVAQKHVATGPLKEVLEALLEGEPDGTLSRLESDLARSLYAAAANEETRWGERGQALVQQRVTSFEKDMLSRKSAKLQEELDNAQRLKNEDVANELYLRKIDVDRQIQRVATS